MREDKERRSMREGGCEREEKRGIGRRNKESVRRQK